MRAIIYDEHAVSEILDTVLLLGVAIVAFGIISSTIFPLPLPSNPPNVKLSAYIRGDYLFIEHMGGDALQFNKTEVSVTIGGESKPKSPLHEINRDGLWECGEYVSYFYNTTDLVEVLVIDTVTNTIILQGNLRRGETPWIGATPPILVSSLRTNTVDEDLTCYALPNSNFNAKTFIYNWKKNGVPIATLIMPFDTHSSTTTKDYSGNGYDGTVNGATWISNGVVGGAYHFDGKDDYISISLPSAFDNISKNNLTISLWIKSNDISSNATTKRCILEAYKNNNNFVQLFQYNSSIQFGVCSDGGKKSVKTPSLNDNTWYHIVAVWNSYTDDLIIYTNAIPSSLAGSREYYGGNTQLLSVGQRTDGKESFSGSIDDLYIYPYVRSDEQIYQDYMDTKNGSSDHRTLVASEITLGDSWSCSITPNDSNKDADVIDSEVITIVSYPGGAP